MARVRGESEADMSNEIPRRSRLDQNTPAELAIRAAVDAVEALPADPRLTDAVVLLQEARESVANYVDGIYELGVLASLRSENSDLRSLLAEARSHNPEKYRSSPDDSTSTGAEIVGVLLPSPSSGWTRVAPSGEGSGQPVVPCSARQRAEEVLAFRAAHAPKNTRFHERSLLVDNGERGSAQKAVIFSADDLSALVSDLSTLERDLAALRQRHAEEVGLLKSIEWHQDGDSSVYVCACCRGM